MKKTIVMFICLCASVFVMAQEVRIIEQAPTTEVVQTTPLTLRGFKLLPQQGDLALGVDLNFLGSYISGNTNPGYSIYMKYFRADDQAIRVRLGVNLNKDTYKSDVQDDIAFAADPTSEKTVTDKYKVGTTEFNLDLGYEFRRGYRRVQGYYGGEVGFSYAAYDKETYSYGNDITATNTTPSFMDFGSNDLGGERLLEAKNANEVSLRLQGFVGVEYFVTSRFSLGLEFGLGFGFTSRGKAGKAIFENWDAANSAVKETTIEPQYSYDPDAPSTNLYFATTSRGSIYLMFYF